MANNCFNIRKNIIMTFLFALMAFMCMSVDVFAGDYINLPEDMELSTYEDSIGSVGGMLNAEDIPEAYGEDKISGYTQTKVQEGNDCWAFASAGMTEINLIKNEEYSFDTNLDLSELQLEYFTYNPLTDPLGGTLGDTCSLMGGADYKSVGGNFIFASRTLFSGVGLATEDLLPYESGENILTGLTDAEKQDYAYGKNTSLLKNCFVVNVASDDAKRAVMEYGGIGVGFYASQSSAWNQTDDMYNCYNPRKKSADHAVIIVGWDDNYSKENFKTTPEGDGAWLVRNSWEDRGYFWLSYYDATVNTEGYVFDSAAEEDLSDHLYQYDGAIYSKACGKQKVANVFRVPETKENPEVLNKVSLSMTHFTDTEYVINIYTDVTLNEDGMALGNACETVTGKETFKGSYTIKLPQDVTVQPGQYFAVVVETSGTNANSLDAESSVNVGTSIKVTAAIEQGQSYYYEENEWKDFSETGSTFGNICIKAYTDEAIFYNIEYDLNGGTNSSLNPDRYQKGTSEELYEPTRTGYTFLGWYLNEDLSGESVSSIAASSEGDIKLYAGWTCSHISTKKVTTPANTKTDGKTDTICATCGNILDTVAISAVKNLTLSASSYTYTGKTRKPKIQVTDNTGKQLASKYYKVTYTDLTSKSSTAAPIAVGKYRVTVTLCGSYTGRLCAYFSIVPKETAVAKLVKGKKCVTVYWKKQSKKTKGYQIQYATSSKFKNAKTVIINSTSTTSKKIKNLKANKKYYVRVRTYSIVKIDGKEVKMYSDWSGYKSVKTLKS